MKNVDARGLSCPQPMLLAKKAMQDGANNSIEVLVDCEASVENIGRVAAQLGWQIQVTQNGDEARIELNKA